VTICVREKYYENENPSSSKKLLSIGIRHLIGDMAVVYKEASNFHEIFGALCQSRIKRRAANIDHLFVDLLMPALGTKSKHWKYEQEVRLIRHKSGRLNISPEKGSHPRREGV
jgi:hypothetical protein